MSLSINMRSIRYEGPLMGARPPQNIPWCTIRKLAPFSTVPRILRVEKSTAAAIPRIGRLILELKSVDCVRIVRSAGGPE